MCFRRSAVLSERHGPQIVADVQEVERPAPATPKLRGRERPYGERGVFPAMLLSTFPG
jgi:hypothetical protein